ncbi:uncharacterized protein LOC132046074, partial [Lycium ferocissimum]|uniref:uncharacterized protein LOC132046074 n=1 Tax=Lycium ferocissimum TaxID=112874 RepID=UPI002814FF66
MTIKLVVGGLTFNIVSAYAPQVGLVEEDKKRFWEELDEVMRGIPHIEKLCLGRDFNGHIETTSSGYDDEHSGFSFSNRNEGGAAFLDFAKAFDLVIANSSFQKREEHLVGIKGTGGGNGEEQGKVKAKKIAYTAIVQSMDDDGKRKNREKYKTLKKEAKLAVTTAKTTALNLREK